MKLLKIITILTIAMVGALESALDTQELLNRPQLDYSNQSAQLLMQQVDDALTEITSRYPENISQEEIKAILHVNFNVFYNYMIRSKPQAYQHVAIMYLQYCDLIFKYGTPAKLLKNMNPLDRESLYFAFINAWDNLFQYHMSPIVDSVYTSINQLKN